MHFNRLAPIYDLIEGLCTGLRMQRSRVAHLGAVRDARRVLLAGEGNGRFLAACVRSLPEAQLTVVDESPAMLQCASDRWLRAGGEADRARFICANLLEWEPEEQGYDLIVTHFFLDCFPAETLQRLLAKLASAATPQAHWLLADFCEPPRGLARLRARWTLHIAYAVFRWLAGVQADRLTVPDDFLKDFHFTLTERSLSDWGMMHSDLWTRKESQSSRNFRFSENISKSASPSKKAGAGGFNREISPD